MAMKCLNCGYIMSTAQEIQSTALHFVKGVRDEVVDTVSKISELGAGDAVVANAVGGIANTEIGNSKGVKCPKCGEYGRWTDYD